MLSISVINIDITLSLYNSNANKSITIKQSFRVGETAYLLRVLLLLSLVPSTHNGQLDSFFWPLLAPAHTYPHTRHAYIYNVLKPLNSKLGNLHISKQYKFSHTWPTDIMYKHVYIFWIHVFLAGLNYPDMLKIVF